MKKNTTAVYNSQMSASVVALVIAAAMLHAVWNAILKSQTDHFAGLFAQLAAVSVIGGIGAVWFGAPPREVWGWLAAGQAAHFAYHCLLAATYKRGDISLAYPVLRGTAPPLAAAGGFLLLGETPSLAAAGGIGIVSAGVLLMAKTGGENRRAVLFALATAATIAIYSLTDAAGARLSGNPAQYLCWLMMLDALLFMPLMLFGERRRRLRALSVRNWAAGALGAVLAIAAYGMILYAYTRAQIGAVAALRETSIVFGALIGMLFLREQKSLPRIVGAAVIAAGAALIALS